MLEFGSKGGNLVRKSWGILILAAPLCAQTPATNAPAALPPPGGSIQQDGTRPARPRGPVVPQGPAPRLADGKPDFSGVWRPDNGLVGDISRILKPGDQIVLKPEYQKIMKERKAGQDPEANCLPTGVPRMAPYPWTIATTPGKLFFLFEGNIHSYRQIFMDGRQHSKDPDPTWYGESIGHWEGDTLVVDTIGFNELFWFDFSGHPHTSQLHVVEQYTRPDLGNLVDEILIDDPGAYEKPFHLIAHNHLDQKGELMEYICQEDNQDPSHIVGPARPL
jgi:hypothetical protein